MTSADSNIKSWIQKTPNVVGGKPCVRNTRISVHGIVEWRKLGLSDDEIMENIEGLTLDDLIEACRYYEASREEIEQILKEEAEA